MKRTPTMINPLRWAVVEDLRQWIETVTSRFDLPHVMPRIDVTGTTTKTVTIRVTNRAGNRVNGRHVLRVFSLNGTALDTNTTFVVATGLLVDGVAAGYREVMTDVRGEAVLLLTYAGTATQTRTLVVDCGGDSEETTLQW